MASDVDIPFLTREFRLFLSLLDRVERQLRTLLRGDLDALDPGLPREPEALRARLVAQLEDGAARARRERYDVNSQDFSQGRYVMAATGDAALGRIDWPGRSTLLPLTDNFPRPSLVAEDLYQQVEDLLDAVPASSALCELYLMALTAGLGSAPSSASSAPAAPVAPNHADAEAQWADARRRLYARLADHRPDLLAPPGDQLFPDAYRLSQPYGRARYIPDLRPWIAALLLILTGLFFAARWTYDRATREIPPALKKPPVCESNCP